MTSKILIATAEAPLRAQLVSLCEEAGWRAFEAHGHRECLAAALACSPQVVLFDHQDGVLEALRALGETCPGTTPWVVFEAGDTVDPHALFEAGCFELLELPLSGPQLRVALAREIRHRQSSQSIERLRAELDQLRHTQLIGQSRPILRVHDQVQRIASTPRTTVLVTGEMGSGKELVARSIHRSSARAQRPFVAVACGATDGERLEALLYGAVSSATSDPGPCAMESAEGGTLYLSQVEHIGRDLQRRVLQLLQDRSWQPTGSNEDRLADVRVIASTAADLARLVDEGRFREDLLYRLNVLSIEVPALRERREDLPELIASYLGDLSHDLGRRGIALAPDAMEALSHHGWAGNLRELRNCIERGLIAARGEVITRSDLGLIPLPGGPGPADHGELGLESFRLRHMEEIVIRRALQSAQGNRSETARLLGVNRTTLYNKLRTYEIDG